MSSAAGERRERRRVVLLFGVTVLPPLALLTLLAGVAAWNDEAALRVLAQDQARQAGLDAGQRLEAEVRRAEEQVFAAIDLSLLRRRDARPALTAALEQARRDHPLARRFFALSLSGEVLWPDPAERPFGEGPPPGTASSPAAGAARALELEQAGRLEEAARSWEALAAASPEQAPAAGLRAGACLARLERFPEALAAYRAVASAPAPAWGEGPERLPLRVVAARRAAELLQQHQPEAGLQAAQTLLGDLLGGRWRQDLSEGAWRHEVQAARHLLETWGAEAAGALARLAEQERLLSERLAWTAELQGPLGAQIRTEAPLASGGEVRHHARLEEPPLVLAWRQISAIPGAEQAEGLHAGALVFGFELDLERLTRDVLAPACGAENARDGAVSLAILDGRGAIVAYAGAAARPDAEGRPRAGPTPAAELPLEPVPAWTLRAVRPALELGQARRQRLLLYAALLGLTLLMAGLGGRATLRSVNRSLELAKLKSDFLSNITHELKTPLTSIKMYSEMLATGRVRTEEKRTEYVANILRESERLEHLIEDVLDFARQDSGMGEKSYVMAEEDVADTVTEAIDLFRASAKVRGFDLYLELPPVGALPPVDLDREAVVRAVLNLLSNAVKYSGDSRWIRVKVAREAAEWIAVSVEDKGIGIDPEDLERIFDRFYRAGDVETRAISGTGLGLSLVDQIVQAHGGQIRVESEKGQGSVFTVLLPVVADYREAWPPPGLDVAEVPAEEGAPPGPPPDPGAEGAAG